jgi:hypothetical protein
MSRSPKSSPVGPTRRIVQLGLALALLLSVAMQDPSSKPLGPTVPATLTYMVFLPVAVGQPQAMPTTLYLPAVLNETVVIGGPDIPFAYGWSVFQYQSYRQLSPNRPRPLYPEYAPSSFNWVKITANPPSQYLCGANRLPYKVLLRLNKTDANATVQNVADDTWQWAHWMETSPGVGQCVDAFEIGNEPNLSGQGEYNGPVDPVKYADQLCAAYNAIKSTDPSFIVVSAGLAPTGGLADPKLGMDSLAFMRAMLEEIRANPISHGDPGGCFDALAYHNYGFRTGFQTDPRDPACPSEMCFRSAEDAWAVLESYGVYKRIWTTETGWMRDYVAGGCGSAPWAWLFAGFALSDQAQADNLVGAFQYARANWPWLGGIFVFNLDFNTPLRSTNPCYDEQGWFAVQGHAAEAALEAMAKTP